ncbi:Stp1/IreP family PP2C-type Ser/Thr phosphatase [Hydrogenoanaerobacterium sp.]|uniref:Stp1/IreP family PP2C-type Ser/Thr phosphatase n=1 Tax=Hydrogenoanaerobacterium sp. TaxID=2953763 RepID=UPI0028A2CD45|nr:Stp1/IreP family PP2C-type Ser/Thr phosphatase [Hydrogenoanaerobacterium sp.]
MLKAYGKTDKGKVRANNQDSFAINNLSDIALLAVVCDGMGGEKGGNIASRNAVNIITQHIGSNYRDDYDSNSIRNVMLSAVSVANALVYEMAKKDENLAGMGTTLVVCVIKNNMAHIVHAGDSRAYLVKNGELCRMTRDHSVVQLLIENGELTEAEAAVHPKKHYITRALGVGKALDAEYTESEFSEGQMLLICTDGLTNHVAEEIMLQTLLQTNIEDVPQNLVSLANAQGGTDNITAVVLCNR